MKEMPDKSVVGTSSLRRSTQVAARYPGLEIRLLRGNVETRLAKLDRGEYDAVLLAVAGLVRLGLGDRIRSYLGADESLPAPGQGALGIECIASRRDVVALLAPLADRAATACVLAERAVSRALGGSCALPLGAFAEFSGDKIHLRALVASADGKRIVRAEGKGADPEALGTAVVKDLRARGATEVLALLGH
jgi:hydroxymethylbilane synthase